MINLGEKPNWKWWDEDERVYSRAFVKVKFIETIMQVSEIKLRFSSKCLYWLNCLIRPTLFFFWNRIFNVFRLALNLLCRPWNGLMILMIPFPCWLQDYITIPIFGDGYISYFHTELLLGYSNYWYLGSLLHYGYWQRWVWGKNSFFLKRLSTRNLTMLQWLYVQRKLDLFFNLWDSKGTETDLGGLESKGVWVPCVKL